MDLDDFIEPEVAIVAAVTAAVASPPVRRAIRKGAVYGIAGVMMLGDRLKALREQVARAAPAAAAAAHEAAEPAAAVATTASA